MLQTVLTHGVYLSDEELHVLAARSSSVSHCPNSYTSLRSGLCDVHRLLDAGIKVGLVTGMIHYTDRCCLMTGTCTEKCIVRRFHHCANVYLHKPRYYSLLHTQTIWYSLLFLGYKPVQYVTVLNTVGNCNTVVSIIL